MMCLGSSRGGLFSLFEEKRSRRSDLRLTQGKIALTEGKRRCIKPFSYLNGWLNGRPPQHDPCGSRRSDPARDPRPARAGRDHGRRAGRAVRHEPSAVSKHLKVLEHAGLIARGREAQWRPCRLQAAPLKDVAEFVEHYRRFWEQSLDRLEDYLHALQAKGEKGDKPKKPGRRK